LAFDGQRFPMTPYVSPAGSAQPLTRAVNRCFGV
jgi:hypothetical protein